MSSGGPLWRCGLDTRSDYTVPDSTAISIAITTTSRQPFLPFQAMPIQQSSQATPTLQSSPVTPTLQLSQATPTPRPPRATPIPQSSPATPKPHLPKDFYVSVKPWSSTSNSDFSSSKPHPFTSKPLTSMYSNQQQQQFPTYYHSSPLTSIAHSGTSLRPRPLTCSPQIQSSPELSPLPHLLNNIG